MSSSKPSDRLVKGSTLIRSVAWNFVGTVLPLAVGVVTIPLLIRGLGVERFGVLTIAWMVIGYFGLFDLGLGRAITKQLAENLSSGRESENPEYVWTAMFLMVLLGIVGGGVLAFAAPYVVGLLHVSAGLSEEARLAMYLMAASVPLVVATSGLRGVLEAYQRFDLATYLRVPLGVLSYAGPLVVLPFSNSLVIVVAVIAFGRLLALIAHLGFCVHVIPALTARISIMYDKVWPLIRFGGWMSLTNIVGPFMVYMDRFFIGAILGATAVAYYVTPYEMVTKLWIIPGVLLGVLFPAFAAMLALERERTRALVASSVRVLVAILFPLSLFLICFASDLLMVWIGADFAEKSARVMQWLVLGVFINCVAQVHFNLLQAAGRADWTGKLHLFELPVYLGALWVGLDRWGIEGAAVVWTLRVLADALILVWLVAKQLPYLQGIVWGQARIVIIAAMVCLGALGLAPLLHRSTYFIIATGVFFFLLWNWILDREEKTLLVGLLKRRAR